MASNAEEYYRRVVSISNPAGFLEFLILVREQENEWLEFKGADKIAEPDVLKYWSKALSGFANTAGGVLIWGIDARKDQTTGIDCACGLALVPDVDVFAQKLSDVLLNSVSPPIRGIEITPVEHTGKQGFVVCLIPEGMAKAHRAEKDRQFYMRMRDNFDVPPVAVIRHLFDPAITPILVPRLGVFQEATGRFRFDVSLTNEGRATAEQMMALIELKTDSLFRALPMKELSRRLNVNASHQIAFELERYLHPYMPPMMFAQYYLQSTAPPVSNLRFRMRLFSRNSSPSSWHCFVGHEDYRHRHTVSSVPDEEPWSDQPEMPR